MTAHARRLRAGVLIAGSVAGVFYLLTRPIPDPGAEGRAQAAARAACEAAMRADAHDPAAVTFNRDPAIATPAPGRYLIAMRMRGAPGTRDTFARCEVDADGVAVFPY